MMSCPLKPSVFIFVDAGGEEQHSAMLPPIPTVWGREPLKEAQDTVAAEALSSLSPSSGSQNTSENLSPELLLPTNEGLWWLQSRSVEIMRFCLGEVPLSASGTVSEVADPWLPFTKVYNSLKLQLGPQTQRQLKGEKEAVAW